MYKALYGCIEYTILWYNIFTKTLKKLNFKVNPNEKCVAQKMADDKKCTIIWYVDDNKLPHVDRKVNDDILEKSKVTFCILLYNKVEIWSSWEWTERSIQMVPFPLSWISI